MAYNQEQVNQIHEKKELERLASAAQPEKDDGEEQILDPEETKRRLKQEFLGKKKKEEYVKGQGYRTKLVEADNKRKLCNEKAVEDFWKIVETIVNSETAGSNLNDKEIEQELYQTIESIIDKIFVNHLEYGIESPEDAEIIRIILTDLCLNTLVKARGGRVLEHKEKNTTISKLEKVGGDESSGGFLSGLFS